MRQAPSDSLTTVAPAADRAAASAPAAVRPDSTPAAAVPFEVEHLLQALPADATPSQLDSAVQAALPRRERFRSGCPDTLSLPGLPGRVPSAGIGADDVWGGGFFTGNPLYAATGQPRPGMAGEPLPYTLRTDDAVTCLLLLCFFVLIGVLTRGRRRMVAGCKRFFFPRRRREDSAADTGSEKRRHMFLLLQLCLVLGLFAFDYMQDTVDLFLCPFSPHVLLGLNVGLCFGYFLLRRLTYGFLNWIFFDKEARREWGESYTLLTGAEGLLLFPLALLAVYADIPLPGVVFGLLGLLLLVKLLFIFKTYVIFFRKKHGFLHLIVYFCALEMVPLLALCKLLARITEVLEYKNIGQI